MGFCSTIQILQISIHSPRARGDYADNLTEEQVKAFQSTPLVRGETIRDLL